MRTKQVFARTTALWGLVAATTSMAVLAAKPPAAEDSTSNPSPLVPAGKQSPAARPSYTGDEGGTAGTPVLIWDNGSIVTSTFDANCPATGQGDKSLLQNTALCLGTNGFTDGGANTFRIADDFTLTQCARIERVTVYGYNTGATSPTVTGATVTLHSSRPFSPTSNVIATATGTVAAQFNPKVFRMAETALGCTRQIQTVEVDTTGWPLLPAGTYWLSWHLNSAAASIFCPPVTILGQFGKAGGNAMQGSDTAGFAQIFDTSNVAAPALPTCPGFPLVNGAAAAAQDMPFRLDGDLPVCTPCVGDINHDGAVGVADLLAVIGAWGPCGSPCPTDLNGDNTTGVADLLTVISNWGTCPPGPIVPPAPATGACTVGATCTNGVTFNSCFLSGGTYGGDGSVCAGACCAAGSCNVISPAACASASGIFAGIGSTCQAGACPPPPNDTCATATPIAATQTFNNEFANTTPPIPNTLTGCTNLGANVTRDVWFTLQTVAATSYTISTGTSAGGVNFDTSIEVLTNNCGTLTVEFCNDDLSATDLRSTVTFTGDGTIKLIRVGCWQNGAVGPVTLTRTP